MILQPTIDTNNPVMVRKQLEAIARIINYDVRFKAAVPIANNAPGNPGDITSDSTNLYVCVSKNLWKIVPLQAMP